MNRWIANRKLHQPQKSPILGNVNNAYCFPWIRSWTEIKRNFEDQNNWILSFYLLLVVFFNCQQIVIKKQYDIIAFLSLCRTFWNCCPGNTILTMGGWSAANFKPFKKNVFMYFFSGFKFDRYCIMETKTLIFDVSHVYVLFIWKRIHNNDEK